MPAPMLLARVFDPEPTHLPKRRRYQHHLTNVIYRYRATPLFEEPGFRALGRAVVVDAFRVALGQRVAHDAERAKAVRFLLDQEGAFAERRELWAEAAGVDAGYVRRLAAACGVGRA